MIRSEVIVVLNNLRNYYNIRQGGEEYTQALDFAISSLLTDEAYQLEYEKPPIIDWNNCHATETLISLDVYKQVCAERDIAIKQLHELGYEFGQKIETTPKNDLGVDAVSRQAVLDLMIQKWGENFSGDSAMQESIDAIRVLPSVTPQEPILDKIRAEIIKKYWDCDICKFNGRFNIRGDINDILQIIDKYKSESEPQESEGEDGTN